MQFSSFARQFLLRGPIVFDSPSVGSMPLALAFFKDLGHLVLVTLSCSVSDVTKANVNLRERNLRNCRHKIAPAKPIAFLSSLQITCNKQLSIVKFTQFYICGEI